MLLQTEHDLVAVLGIAAAILLAIAIAAGVLAVFKSRQVRQFQDMLFKADRKIDNLERRMFNVLNAVPVALVETDNTGKFTFANKAAHTLMGRKDSELIGLRFHSATWGIAYPDGRAIPPDLMPIARTLRGQTVKGFQHLLSNHGSKEKVLVSVTSMPIMNGVGEVIGTTSAMIEIETQTGEGVDDLTGLWRGHWFAAATVPFWGLDSKGQILDINAAAAEAFDIKREQALGKSWAQVFADDADFQKALDYLGDVQETGEAREHKPLHLNLKTIDGLGRPSSVCAWLVRASEEGEHGLTIMALPAEVDHLAHAASFATALPIDHHSDFHGADSHIGGHTTVHEPLSDEDALELEDLRQAEVARSALGVGVWQYDSGADAIIEDEGMMALIGRVYPGGPTLISEGDQALADTAFGQLMSGETDHLSLDIKVVHKDNSEHWISLKGQSTLSATGTDRHIFGVAFDCTQWKQTAPAPESPEVVPDVAPLDLMVTQPTEPVLTEADLAAAREAGRKAGLEEGYADALAEIEAARTVEPEADAATEHDHTLYTWNPPLGDDDTMMPHSAPEPVIMRDPEILAENEALKAQIEALQQQLHEVDTAHDDLKTQYDTLTAAPPEPAPEPDFSEHDARIDALQAQLQSAQDARNELQNQLDMLVMAPVAPIAEPEPAPEPDYSEHEAKISALQADLAQAEDAQKDLQARLTALQETPPPEPDFTAHEAQIEALQSELQKAQDAHAATQAQLEDLAAKPLPEPDYSEWRDKLMAAQFELAKWQAAYHDTQAKLDEVAATPTVAVADHQALESRLDDLQKALSQSQTQHQDMQSRLDQLDSALSSARRFETVGRLTSDVAYDFAQMLNVINGALEVMARQNESPESVKRLSEAALAAGKRGERLTRQLQAFQSEDY